MFLSVQSKLQGTKVNEQISSGTKVWGTKVWETKFHEPFFLGFKPKIPVKTSNTGHSLLHSLRA